MDLQSLFPIYLPKGRTEDQTKEAYETQVAQNENNTNQNFTILFNAIRELADIQSSMQQSGGEAQTIIQTVTKPSGGGGEYTLPAATKNTLGGVIVGENLDVASDGTISVSTASEVEEDNTKPITSAAVFAEVGNINALLETI